MIPPIPAVIKIVSIFGLILILNRLRLNLGLSLLVSSFALAQWTGLTPSGWLRSAFETLTRVQTVSLILIVAFILVISRIMESTGHLKRIMASFSRMSRDDRASGSAMAALIGLLPMPGGALFSAPMVDTALSERKAEGEIKTAVNYWFRHIWEFWWPLYPGVVLVVALLEVPTWHYMAVMAPMTMISVAAGVFLILKPLGRMPRSEPSPLSRTLVRGFIREITPILIVVASIPAISGFFGMLAFMDIEVGLPPGASILPGLAASAIWVCAKNHATGEQLKSAVFNRGMAEMLFLVAAIMVLRGVMGDGQAVSQVRDELLAYQIPAVVVILFLPFLSGLVTGISIGFVGSSFPLIIPLIPFDRGFTYLIYAGLAFTFGYMGMMLSPVHLCLLVSKDYFGATMIQSYRYLVYPVLSVLAAATILFGLALILVS